MNDPIDTTNPQGRLIFNIFASLAEFERDVIRERTQAGLRSIGKLLRFINKPIIDNRHTMSYHFLMSEPIIYEFDPEKNAKLISLRGISFEQIISALGTDKLLDVVVHPNTIKYPNQKIYVIEHNNYAYLIPFVENGNKIFLKTAFPNREATKYYLKSRGDK